MDFEQINTNKRIERVLVGVRKTRVIPNGFRRVYFRNGGNCKIRASHRLIHTNKKRVDD